MSTFATILKLGGYPIAEAIKELIRIHSLNKEAFDSWQQKQAWQIVKYHFNNNDFYRRKVGKVLPDKWNDLPIISKQDLQQPLQNLLSRSIRLRDCYRSSTSGSTGTPFFFAKDKFTHAMTWALIMNRYEWHGIDMAHKQARFYGMPKEFRGRISERLKDSLMNRERFPVFDLSDSALEVFLKRFTSTRFKYLYGYTSALALFARFLEKRGVILKDVCPSIHLCISTSEMCSPLEHILFERVFGITHIREYGLSETCITGFDDRKGVMKLTEETLYNEVADANLLATWVGEGELLSTSLFNKAIPMIRYRTGDNVTLQTAGNGIHRIIGSLTGRTNDVIVMPDGKRAAGLTFYYIAKGILEETGMIREFIIRQIAIDRFAFDVVTDRDFTLHEVDMIKNKVAQYLQPGLTITINKVEAIQRPQSGKLKHFYSEL